MLIRALAVAALLSTSGITAFALSPAQAQTETAAISVAELMQATALDEVFTQFGAAIAASPQEQGVPFDAMLTSVWAEAAREVFDARSMHGALANALDGKFSREEEEVLAAFFRSDFGRRITELERAVQTLGPEAQLSARAEGLSLVEAIGDGSRRDLQFDEMMALVSADIASAMVGQSVRGMLIGMSLAQQRGDIEVPWEEIDQHLAQILPGIEADVAATQRAMMAYAYRDLPEEDLDRYLGFLRTPAAQRFYALASYSIGRIVTDSMTTFGETLASKMGRVNI
jgi:hypothetical protein